MSPTSRANEVSFVYVAPVVLTQIYFKAKSGNGCLINYDTEFINIDKRFVLPRIILTLGIY